MGNHRKSLFDTRLIFLIQLCWITESHYGRALELNETGVDDVKVPTIPVSLVNDGVKSFGNILIRREDLYNSTFENSTKWAPEQNNKLQREIDGSNKETEINKRKEDFSTFATFLVEIIVFFVFLAILLSFITLCARKCGGNPSNSGRIYGPGPIMGSLMAEPDSLHYEPVTGLTQNFGGIVQTASFSTDHPIGYFAPRSSVAAHSEYSHYSDYQSEVDDQERIGGKRPKKKRNIPGPKV